MNFVNEQISDYAESMSSDAPDYLNELLRATHLRIVNGRMSSGFLQGRLLSSLSKMINPKVILDIGTFSGYSALCLAEGLSVDGRLITLERNEELEVIQNEFIGKSPYRNQIEQVVCDALEYLKTMSDMPDLIFLDADKSTYLNFWNVIKERMPSGGHLIADNVLWYGKVLKEEDPNDPSTAVLKEFNHLIRSDPQFEVVLLPLRDGLSLIRKK